MTTTLGTGSFAFEVVGGWGILPEGWSYKEVGGVGVDSADRVYVFGRGEHPMIVFDREGNFLTSWGEEVFRFAHAVTMGPDDTIYCTDALDHTVKKCTLEGDVLMTLGVPGESSPYQSGRPFNRCTHVALDPDTGEIYVSDGYGNSRVHKYSPDGTLLFSWGEPGTDPGQFNVPHNICTDKNGYVYVADRENHRLQVFDRTGRFETQWVNMHRPCGLFMEGGSEERLYVTEFGPGTGVSEDLPNAGPRVDVYSTDGRRLARIGDREAVDTSSLFIAPHGIALDSRGDMYVGEVSWTVAGSRLDPPRELTSLQKLARVPAKAASP